MLVSSDFLVVLGLGLEHEIELEVNLEVEVGVLVSLCQMPDGVVEGASWLELDSRVSW